jgi:hypothetical protein
MGRARLRGVRRRPLHRRAAKLVPGSDELRCSGKTRRVVDCEGAWKGHQVLCEFRYVNDESSLSCWSER